MDKESKKIIGLFSRYIVIILAGLGNLYLFYKILTPITIVVLRWAISIFTTPVFTNNFIFIKGIAIIEIVPACIAGAAFYLLFILIFSSADIEPIKRLYAAITAFAILFVLNILRILLLIPMIRLSYFAVLHWTFWHLLSTVFVLAAWFAVVKIYKIKSIPGYSDLKYMKSLMQSGKKTKRKKKNK